MRRRLHWFVLVLLCFGLVAAVAARRAERWGEKTSVPAGVVALRNISYGDLPEQNLDVYRPESSASSRPLILMVHGGAWRIGDKDSRGVVNNKLAHWLPRGYVLVTINYRMLPELDGLEQADDVARALAFVQAHARGWGADPDRVVLMGHSAGAHLVALLSSDPARAAPFGVRPWLGTVALDSAALDLVAVMRRRHLSLYDKAFGHEPARWLRASPLQAITSAARPLLAVCSSQRRDHPCEQAEAYAAAATRRGIRVSVLPQDLDHAGVNRELGLPGAYTDAVDAFLQSIGAGR
jgi:acetyl esterase/lipase